jgi:uncharacterized repeat protein (TIGR01451 family)
MNIFARADTRCSSGASAFEPNGATTSQPAPTRPIPWHAAVAGLSLLALVLCTTTAHAQFKITQTFANSTAPGWVITGTNNAGQDDSGILTGNYGSIPNNVNDANGSGWLRLTTNRTNQTGTALYTGGSFSSTLGVVVDFEYLSWGGTGADGLSFFLYDAATSMAGAAAGASLGYCAGVGGYLGIGLDEFGNFSSNGATGRCPNNDGPGQQPDAVVVRGPQTANNPYIGGASVGLGIDAPGVTTRPTANRVRYFLVPNGAGGYRVTVGLGLAGTAPVNILSALNFPYVAPAQLRIGIAGATGGAHNIHEVRNVTVAAPADIAVTKTVVPSAVQRGQQATYTLVVSNNDINPVDAGNQAPPIDGTNAPDIVDTVPAQLTGVTWTCAASVGSTCPAANGAGNLAISGGYTMAPGGTLTFTITGTVDPATACGATVGNTASAVFSATDGYSDINLANNSASASFTVVCRTLTLTKVSNGGTGAFTFSGTNGWTSQTITTTTAGTGVAGAAQVLAASGVATTITEVTPVGWTLSSVNCTGMGAGGAVAVSGNAFTLNAAAVTNSSEIACTVVNTGVATLRLQKVLPGGRLVATDQFTLSIAGAGGPVAVTTSGATNAPAEVAALSPAIAGTAYTLSEAAGAGADLADYTTTFSCSNALPGGQSPAGSGVSFSLTPVPGDDLRCTFSNVSIPRADLSVVKSSSAANVRSGDLVVFTLTGTNTGPSAADGAVIRDVASAGLDCTTPSATASCSANGGAACPGAAVPVADLLGPGGVTIPILPAGGSVAITLQCRVTATGLP